MSLPDAGSIKNQIRLVERDDDGSTVDLESLP
jgi:hypothetical protein